MNEENIKFTRLKQPLNKWTFKAPKIKKWVEEKCYCRVVLNLFGGLVRLNEDNCVEISNDIDTTFHTDYHMEALELVKKLIKEGCKYSAVLLDPPYSYRKSMELYKGHRNSKFKQILDLIPQLLTDDGIVITFGYHSSVMSNKRGFKIEEILIISHGGAMHDTIVTVEARK